MLGRRGGLDEIPSVVAGLKVYFWLNGSTCCDQVQIFRHTVEILGAELKSLGTQFQIVGAPTCTPKEYFTLQKERLRLCVANLWTYSSSINTMKTN